MKHKIKGFDRAAQKLSWEQVSGTASESAQTRQGLVKMGDLY